MGQGVPWWSRDGKRPGLPQAPWWAVGIRVQVNATTVGWEIDRRVEFASPAAMRWDELAGVVACEARDDGTAPACLLVVRRNTWLMDLLPMENEGMADLLAGARERGLMRSWADICRERSTQARSRAQGA